MIKDNHKNDKFYQRELSQIQIIDSEPGTDFVDLNDPIKLGQTLENVYSINKQPLLIFSPMPEYKENYQPPFPNSRWTELIQTWDGSKSNNEFLYTKTIPAINGRNRIFPWRDIDYFHDPILNHGIKENKNLIRLHCIGAQSQNNILNHTGIAQANHFVWNFVNDQIKAKIPSKKLLCNSANIITKTEYNDVAAFHNLTTHYGASKDYFDFVNNLQKPNKISLPIFNVKTSISSPGYLGALTTAPMNLSKIIFVRDGCQMVFAMEEFKGKKMTSFLMELNHLQKCPHSALTQNNIFPEIWNMNKLAKKNKRKIYCGVQHSGSMALIQSKCIHWTIPLYGRDMWTETLYWGGNDSSTLKGGKEMLKSQGSYFFEFENTSKKTKKGKKKKSNKRSKEEADSDDEKSKCPHFCENIRWKGDEICHDIIEDNQYTEFEQQINESMVKAKYKESKRNSHLKQQEIQRLSKLTKTASLTKVYMKLTKHIFCIFVCNLPHDEYFVLFVSNTQNEKYLNLALVLKGYIMYLQSEPKTTGTMEEIRVIRRIIMHIECKQYRGYIAYTQQHVNTILNCVKRHQNKKSNTKLPGFVVSHIWDPAMNKQTAQNVNGLNSNFKNTNTNKSFRNSISRMQILSSHDNTFDPVLRQSLCAQSDVIIVNSTNTADEVVEMTCICPDCDQLFLTQSQFEKHIRTHQVCHYFNTFY